MNASIYANAPALGGKLQQAIRVAIVAVGLSNAAAVWSESSGPDYRRQAYQLEIERQPLIAVLSELSANTGISVSVLASSAEVGALVVGPLTGNYTVESALNSVIASSDLTYVWVNERTVTIMRQNNRPRLKLSRLDSVSKQPVETGGTAVNAGTMAAVANDQEAISANRRRTQRGDVEEVIVSAQRRDERLTEVPISISVLGGETLDKSTAQGLSEELGRVPAVGYSESYQGGGTQLSVRGVTAGSANFNGSSPIAYYLDFIPFGLVKSAFVPDANAYDLERIEVLRGPQGTLYGASAQNGVVRVLTRDASLDKLEFKARGSLSSTQDGGENYRGDAAFNLPIVEGKLAVRAIAGYQDLGGWIDRPNRKDANDVEVANLRLKVNAQPTEKLAIAASIWQSRADYGGPSIADINGRHNATLDEPITTDFDGYGLRIAYDFPAFSLSSTTSYIDFRNDSYTDLAPFGLIDTLNQTLFDSEVFTQEINLRSSHDGSWQWSLGGIYRDGEDRLFQFRRQFVAPISTRDLSESYAVFGELTRLFADGRMELTGGLRYFSDDVSNREVSRSSGVPASQLIMSDSSFDKVSPRVVLTWHASRNATVYTSYAEGFRSGFPQNPNVIVAAPQIPPLDADNLKNYEIGAKGILWNGALTYDAAVFYMDWQKVQQTLTVNVGTPTSPQLVTALVNGESASGPGFEASISSALSDELSLGVSFSWNDLAVDSDIHIASSGAILFKESDRLNLSPEYTAGAFANYSFPLGEFVCHLATSANYVSERDWRTIVSNAQRIRHGDAITIGRASIAIERPDVWTATLYMDNVGNEQGSPARQPFAAAATDWDAQVRPRTVGMQFELQF